jgi:hypothetical protein
MNLDTRVLFIFLVVMRNEDCTLEQETTRWLSTPSVAERFDVTPRTLNNWKDQIPDFPIPAVVNGRKLWKESEIIEWEKRLVRAKISESISAD